MAASDDDGREPSRQQCSADDNPLIAFRKLADETVASLLHGLIGLPSVFNALDPSERWIPIDERARRRTMQSWGAAPQEEANAQQEPPTDRSHNEPATDMHSTLLGWSRERNEHFGLMPPQTAYVPREMPPRSGRFQPWSPLDFAFYSHENTCRPMGEWLERYLTGSPYSPVYLERRRDLEHWGSSWRRAFEDLIGAQYGIELKPEGAPRYNAYYMNAEEKEGSLDWVMRLCMRKELRERRMCELEGEGSHTSRWRRDGEEETELDMYEELLKVPEAWGQGAKQKRGATSNIAPLGSMVPENLQDEDRSLRGHGASASKARDNGDGTDARLGIISTLTTTERVVLPDGTTNTKVVLKKRFADGREETNETVHSTKGGQASPGSALEWADGREQAMNDETKQDKHSGEKKGWFWS
jgi:hypothetical protein